MTKLMAKNANMIKTYEELKELLDSDDELPNDYIEEQGIADYEDDTRFDKIEFKWLSNLSDEKQYKKSSIKPSIKQKVDRRIIPTDIFNEETLNNKTKNLKVGEKYILMRGILKREDIFCLKSIETYISDATLLWYIKFLIYKDFQLDYSHLKSCLVDDYTINNNKYKITEKSNLKKHNFEFIVKN